MSDVFLVQFLFLIMAFIFGMLLLESLVFPSKSKQYRQTLADMYVAGKIKQIADKDGINLNAEFLEFAKVTKNKKIDFEALDSTVERELQEKIAEGNKAAIASGK